MQSDLNAGVAAFPRPQASDLEGIARNGARARARGFGYFENPHLLADPDRVRLEELFVLASAWWAGWLKEDAGRTESIHRMLAQRFW